MRRARCSVLVGAALLLGVACAGSRDDPRGPAVGIDPAHGKYDLFTSPAEVRALRFAASDGKTVTVFTDRDALGGVKRITSLYVQDPVQLAAGTGTALVLGADGRPTRVVGADGAVLRVSWRTRWSGRINALSGDGSAQATTYFGERHDGHPSWVEVDEDGEDEKASEDWSSERVLASCATGGTASALAPAAPIEVRVKRCGAPAEPGEVERADVVIEGAKPPLTYPAASRDGACVVGLPFPWATTSSASHEGPPSTSEVQRVCSSLGEATMRACRDEHHVRRLEHKLCNTLAPALDSLDAEAKRSLLETCHGALASLADYCGATTSMAAGKGAPAAICSHLHGAYALPLGARPRVARGRATIAGVGTRESAETLDLAHAAVHQSEVDPAIEVDFGADTTVMPIEIDPPHPLAGERYTVKVRVLCAVGKEVRIPVVDSEGASDLERTYTVKLPGEVLTLRVRAPKKAGSTQRIRVLVDGVQERDDMITF